MEPVSFQLRNDLPKRGWDSSHASSFGDEREKHQTARSKNGVVGRTGKKAPAMPVATIIHPKPRYTYRMLPAVSCLYECNSHDRALMSSRGGRICAGDGAFLY